MKIKLTLKERFVMSQLLPAQGNMITMVIADDILLKTAVRSKEVGKYDIKYENGRLKWNPDADLGEEFELNDVEMKLLSSQVEVLDKEGNITQELASLCRKVRGL